MEREFGSVETRNLNGYTFKVFDEERGYFVEVWKNGEKISEDYIPCLRINCVLTDDELMALVEPNRHNKGF